MQVLDRDGIRHVVTALLVIAGRDGGADLEGAVAQAEIVVEAVPEDLAIKQAVWARVGAAAQDSAVLASNTSGLPIGVLGAASGRPDQMVGTHFFNPVPAMRLVEVVRAADTDPAVLARALEFCRALGKETVEVADLPGFVTPRLGTILMCEAIRCLQEGVASAAHIDTGMKLGANHPMGPLELADFIGLDTCLSVMQVLHEGLADSKYRPCPLLVKYVEAGWVGRKVKRGFYDYSGERPVPTR